MNRWGSQRRGFKTTDLLDFQSKSLPVLIKQSVQQLAWQCDIFFCHTIVQLFSAGRGKKHPCSKLPLSFSVLGGICVRAELQETSAALNSYPVSTDLRTAPRWQTPYVPRCLWWEAWTLLPRSSTIPRSPAASQTSCSTWRRWWSRPCGDTTSPGLSGRLWMLSDCTFQ